jgi:hypothetical protein
MVRIRFSSEDDEVQGFYLLATNTRLRGLPNGIYEVSRPSLGLLDEHNIKYVVVSPSEANLDEAQAVRNPLTVEL